MKFYSKTDIGKKRETNQDSVGGEIVSDNLAWTVVCDGMGGIKGGDVASTMAVEKITETIIRKLHPELSEDQITELMQDSIYEANKDIYEKSISQKELQGMGTTVVLGMIVGNNLYVMHAGDSRAYLISGPGIKQIGVDHSIVQEMVTSGQLTPEEAKNHLQKNIITRALGIGEKVELDYNKEKLKDQDVLLVCTDGLSNHLEDGEIYQIVCKEKLSDVPTALISECNCRGGKDNITVSLLKYEEND